MSDQRGSISTTFVVGVVREQPDSVLREAILFAQRFDAELALATADIGRYEVNKESDGTVVAWSIDPDLADEVEEKFEAGFAKHLEQILKPTGVRYSFHALAGEPTQQLTKLANELDAMAIIVGTRKRGFKTSMHEFFEGSIAAHLAHRQHRPVIVIPNDPVGFDEKLPWEQ